jgi:hypothetical protein
LTTGATNENPTPQHHFFAVCEDEVQEPEQWGSAMNVPNLNQALKCCIAYTIKHTKPDSKGRKA